MGCKSAERIRRMRMKMPNKWRRACFLEGGKPGKISYDGEPPKPICNGCMRVFEDEETDYTYMSLAAAKLPPAGVKLTEEAVEAMRGLSDFSFGDGSVE